MKNFKITYPIILTLLTFIFTSSLYAGENFDYTLTTDVVYGEGVIAPDGKEQTRDLLMDVYQPSGKENLQNKPAVILVHGGAFHRGGLRQSPYKEAGAVHSRVEDYARLLAPLGYTVFTIEYRLAPEFPVPEMKVESELLEPYRDAITESGLRRTNMARGFMGLPALPDNDHGRLVIWNTVLSAAEDANKAVMHIRESSTKYGIDKDKIAMGGHSAGAATVLNATYGLKSPVTAIFPLSPPVLGFDMEKVIDSPELPPMLLVMSQNDEPAVAEQIPSFLKTASHAGLKYNYIWVPGFNHFYPTGAVSLGDDGRRMSVGDRVIDFLEEHLK